VIGRDVKLAAKLASNGRVVAAPAAPINLRKSLLTTPMIVSSQVILQLTDRRVAATSLSRARTITP
jgi:hypothetical protein